MKNKASGRIWPFLLIITICLYTLFAVASMADDTPAKSNGDTTATITESVSSTEINGSTTSSMPVTDESEFRTTEPVTPSFDLDSIPAYSGNPYVAINNNEPDFGEREKKLAKGYEYYSKLDSLGRCGTTLSVTGRETMPTEERGPIGSVKPTGWHTVKYSIVDGNYLYNRCHLIGYQLTAENANERNLITGTRYLNVIGMLPFENMVADYIKETGNHVLYRVTPVFDGDNLLASGVQMEGWSLEDDGSGICFNVFCYNVQPGIGIDYSDGESWLSDEPTETADSSDEEEMTYILNTRTKKFHYPYCSAVGQMSERNKQEYTGTRDSVTDQGYVPCKRCNP